MTPDKNKKPLPFSASTAFPEQPTTCLQWKAILHRVKLLYLRGQWKQCSVQCNQLLEGAKVPPHSLHETYLHFYAALSNEAVARLMHDLSTSKLYTLDQAKKYYLAAASSLPETDLDLGIDDDRDSISSTISTSSGDSCESWSLPSPLIDNTPAQEISSPFSLESTEASTFGIDLTPSPLRSKRTVIFGHKFPVVDSNIGPPPKQRARTPPQKPRLPSIKLTTPTTPSTPSITFSDSTSTWLQSRMRERYNTNLLDFSEMLTNHISTISSLIQATKAAQSNRYKFKRLESYGEDVEARSADLKARIVRLKAIGWRRERFVPEKYQELCAMALVEL